MSPLGLLGETEETIPPGVDGRRRKKMVAATGISIGALVTALASWGPPFIQKISEFAELRADMQHVKEQLKAHEKEHERLRDWLRRVSSRNRYYHGEPPAEAAESAPQEEPPR